MHARYRSDEPGSSRCNHRSGERACRSLAAENATLKEQLADYRSWEQARYDGAKHARAGGKIEDCPYGSLKPTSELRDSTKEGLWKQGFDTATHTSLQEQLAAKERECVSLNAALGRAKEWRNEWEWIQWLYDASDEATKNRVSEFIKANAPAAEGGGK
jgi:hypothetical protein